MKVTVCFGAVRIVVPCGCGELLVNDLINEAIRRYKKAVGKEPNSWVSVHHLSTQSGILDPDDCIRDVADDREEILASFEDSGPDPGVPQGGGDGASGSSSVGTGSPDIFRDPTNTDAPTNAGPHTDHSTPHIEITNSTMCPVNGLGLQVRRSSDPNMLATLKAEIGNKRWSAAAPHYAGDSPERIPMDKSGNLTPQWEEEDDSGQQHTLNAPAQQQPFSRSGRLSMQFLGGDNTGYKWMDAAEKLQNQQQQQQQQQQHTQQTYQQHNQPHHQQQSQQQQSFYSTKSLPRESKRKEPLGQAYESIREKAGEMLLIINEQGSRLGFTAIPDNENGGGLLVQNVEPGSRADRGRLRLGDRILEINGMKLIGLTEGKIQEQLRRSLDSSELRVRVIRADQKAGSKAPRRRDSKVAEMIEAEEKIATGHESKIATVSPTRKPHTAPVGTSLQIANTRKLGRKIEIALTKGPKGLGFSVTTRDNPAGGQCPIYIKNIMAYGAAIEDGRLKPGDRLLEVDGVPITGKTQSEVVAILRATQPGATVNLVVSRQQDLNDSDEKVIEQNGYHEKENDLNSPPKPPAPVLPTSLQRQQEQTVKSVKKSSSARSIHEQQKQLQQQQQISNEFPDFIDAGSESAASNDSLKAGIAWHSRETLTLHIPVHDTEKAGLGVSVKGKTNSNNHSNSSGSGSSIKHDGDLGIFIKSVFHGGAASRDGRLRMNDQLLSVNGVSLLGQNNAEAMDTLRRAMVNNPGKHPGMITLTVARKISRAASSSDILDKTNDSSNTSENSGATVIYLTPDKKDARCKNNGDANNDVNRWSNPVLDRLTGGVCSSNSSQQGRRPSRDNLLDAASMTNKYSTPVGPLHSLRNESYYLATHDTVSPTMHQANYIHGGHMNNNNSVLIEDDPEPMSPTLPHRANDSSFCTQSSANTSTATGVVGGPVNFDATYSSQLSLETNNSGVEHFSRDALGRRSMSEKHHTVKDARETDTYKRNKQKREERERERRIQLTKSAVYGGSVESLTVRIAQANAQVPGYKHTKTASGIDPQILQAEARDQVGDLGPSLGLKKSSSLESLQTMVQEIQMSDEPRGRTTTLRAPRGRGREEGLREAVVNDAGKPSKPWLFEDGHTDADGGFSNRGPFQSSLNDGKHKSRCKKTSILRGIGHMFRFGKNRKDAVVPVDQRPTRPNATNGNNATAAAVNVNEHTDRAPINLPQNQIPAAALAAMDRNPKLAPPAYQQPPPPLPPQNNSNCIGINGIQQNDTFNQRYPHYANYDEPQPVQHQISDDLNQNSAVSDVLSESTLECMRQQVLKQRIKCDEAESRRHQHYHSQRSARSQDISFHGHHHNLSNNLSGSPSGIRPTSSYYEYETVSAAMQQHRSGSLKHNGHTPPITINASAHQQPPQPHWKIAAMNGFSPSSLNGSARSRGPFVTQVNIGNSSSPNAMAVQQQQPTYQTVQRQQPQYANNVGTNASKM